VLLSRTAPTADTAAAAAHWRKVYTMGIGKPDVSATWLRYRRQRSARADMTVGDRTCRLRDHSRQCGTRARARPSIEDPPPAPARRGSAAPANRGRQDPACCSRRQRTAPTVHMGGGRAVSLPLRRAAVGGQQPVVHAWRVRRNEITPALADIRQ
jgi:hypothetical protein